VIASSRGHAVHALVAGLLIICPALALACGWPTRELSFLLFDSRTAQGNMLLSDGGRGRLSGMRVRPPAGSEGTSSRVLSPWPGAAVALLEPSWAPDRWGRVAVAAVSQGPDPGRDLALSLLEFGVAMV
jgi:hypothetical protein